MAVVAIHPDPVMTNHIVGNDCVMQQQGAAQIDQQSCLGEETIVTVSIPFSEPESASAFGLRTAGEVLTRYLADDGQKVPLDTLTEIERLDFLAHDALMISIADMI